MYKPPREDSVESIFNVDGQKGGGQTPVLGGFDVVC